MPVKNWAEKLEGVEIAVICPTRDRPTECKRMIESVFKTSEKACVITWIDEDQVQLYGEALAGMGPRLVLHFGSRVGPISAVNSICHHYREPLRVYGMVPDDCWFETPGWDEYLMAEVDKFKRRIGVVAAAHNGGDYVNFPWLSREWIDACGWYYYPHNFHHCGDSIVELLGDCTAITYTDPEKFKIHHELVHTFNRDKFAADCLNFLTWCVGERRDTVKGIRYRIEHGW